MKKKKGFTLIELIVVMSILTTFLGYSLINFKSFSNIQNDVDVQISGNTLVDFIVNSKKYCRDNNVSGYIYFITNRNTAQFCSNTNVISCVKLPKNFSDLSVNIKGGKIFIDNRGFTGDACTIKFKDSKGGLHNITICVGTATVTI